MGYKFRESKRIAKIEIEDKIYPVEITKDFGERLKAIKGSEPVNVKDETAAFTVSSTSSGIFPIKKSDTADVISAVSDF